MAPLVFCRSSYDPTTINLTLPNFLLECRYAFEVSLKEKVQTVDDATAWTEVAGWTAAAPKVFKALAVGDVLISESSEPGFIVFVPGNKNSGSKYSVLTPFTLASNTEKFYEATVRAVYVDGTKSDASVISTVTADYTPVSGITLIKGNPLQTPPEGLLLSWVGHDNTDTKL